MYFALNQSKLVNSIAVFRQNNKFIKTSTSNPQSPWPTTTTLETLPTAPRRRFRKLRPREARPVTRVASPAWTPISSVRLPLRVARRHRALSRRAARRPRRPVARVACLAREAKDVGSAIELNEFDSVIMGRFNVAMYSKVVAGDLEWHAVRCCVACMTREIEQVVGRVS